MVGGKDDFCLIGIMEGTEEEINFVNQKLIPEANKILEYIERPQLPIEVL